MGRPHDALNVCLPPCDIHDEGDPLDNVVLAVNFNDAHLGRAARNECVGQSLP